MGVPIALHFLPAFGIVSVLGSSYFNIIFRILLLFMKLRKLLYKTVLGNSLRTFDNTQLFKCH